MEGVEYLQEFIDIMRRAQKKLIQFFRNEVDSDSYFQKINDFINDQQIRENKFELKALLHIIASISTNFHRCPDFFEKIEKILKIFEPEMKEYYSKFDIFNTFKTNKRILLFLFNEGIITPDKTISLIIKYVNRLYPQFFYPEFKKFIDDKLIEEIEKKYGNIINNKENPDLFDKMRKVGENEKYICELIRNDSIDEFVAYVNKNNLSLSSLIEKSIFETNTLLIKRELNLIEYSAFFGSVQV